MKYSEDLKETLTEQQIEEVRNLEILDIEFESISRRMGTNGEKGLHHQRKRALKKFNDERSRLRKKYSADKYVIVNINGSFHSILFCTKEFYEEVYGEERYQEYYQKYKN